MVKEIKTEIFEGLAVLVPDLISGYKMYDDFDATILDMDINYGIERKHIRLPKAKYELLGKAEDLPEDVCESIGYYNPRFQPRSCRRHFTSLMRKMDIDTGTWLILKKEANR